MNQEQAAWYLAAMIDGEGWVSAHTGSKNRAVRIANTDPALIAAIQEACTALGIEYHMTNVPARRANWTPGQVVNIYGRENLRKIHELVPFRAPQKRERLASLLTTYREPLDAGELSTLYGQGATIQQLADHFGCGIKRVQNARRTNNIPVRTGAEKGAIIWQARRRNRNAE